MLWFNTANNLLYMRNQSDSAWIIIGTLNQSTNKFEVANIPALTQATWQAGTDTTEAVVSPAKVKAAIDSLGQKVTTATVNTAIASLSGSISHYLNIQGPASTLSATCASSTVAISQAADQLLLNRADIMIAGGAEAPLASGVREMFEAAGILADPTSSGNLCRAFDLNRSGSALGEGAAFFILEREDDALRRGAIPLVALRGWISGMDPTGRAKVDESGGLVEKLIRQLLLETATPASSVNLIHSHGTGTRLNDLAESSVI